MHSLARWRENLDQLHPRDGPAQLVVLAKKNGACLKCGRCCSLITLPWKKSWLMYWVERKSKWVREFNGPKETALEQWESLVFILKHWRRVGREEAARRGVRVPPGKFSYACSLLREDGTCPVHDESPAVCRDFPVYQNGKSLSYVPASCGFADRRRKPE